MRSRRTAAIADVFWLETSERRDPPPAASYIDRILRGSSPGELPIQAPNKLSLIVNQKTAKDLGISRPMHLLASADEVIE